MSRAVAKSKQPCVKNATEGLHQLMLFPEEEERTVPAHPVVWHHQMERIFFDGRRETICTVQPHEYSRDVWSVGFLPGAYTFDTCPVCLQQERKAA